MTKKRILIVEDEKIIADDIRSSLESLGYEVADIAATGEDAIKKAVELRPDLVLMDIILKGNIDGIKAASHIRQNYNIPVVYLTSHSDEPTLRRARESGPFGYILKPFDLRDLRTTMEMAFHSAQVERALKDSERWLSVTLRSIGDAIIVIDAAGRVEFLNPAAEALTGWALTDIVGRPFAEAIRLQDAVSEAVLPDISAAVMGGGAPVRYAEGTVLVARGGAMIHVDVNASPIRDRDDAISGVVAIFHDITERIEAESAVRKSEHFLSTVFESIHDPFCVLDRDYRIVRANSAYARFRSKHMDELIGRVCYETYSSDGTPNPCVECPVTKTLSTGEPCSVERYLPGNDGVEVWSETYTYPVLDEKGAISRVVEYTRDITERKRGEIERSRLIKELEYLSRTDRLTKLYNRGALIERLDTEVERVNRYGSSLSLILCDIDNFKPINNTYGHAEGDRALELISSILSAEVRATDIVGRHGGDEFMVILPESNIPSGREIAERIRKAVERAEFVVGTGEKLRLSLSVGLTTFVPEDVDFNPMMKRADDALYISKRGGRNRVSVISA